MASFKEKVYSLSPLFIQHLLVSAFGLPWYWERFGPGFETSVAEYKAREHFTLSQWEAYQKKELQRIGAIAANHVPYYVDHWNVSEKAAARAGNVRELPLLEKEEVRKNSPLLIRQDVHPSKIHKFLTSGTTGTPIVVYFTRQELRRSLAIREVRSANWAGVSFRMPRSTFSGRFVEPDPASRGPFYRFNIVERQIYFSAFHLSLAHAPQYANAFARHQIQWGTGYAVSYYLLAKYLLDLNIRVPGLKAIITTSEKVTPEMREIMQLAYGCKVFEEYSTVENALFASECAQGKLHVSPDAGYVEILRPDGSPCRPGEIGEVVTTCLNRDFQPFIRFRLGDLAAWDDQPCTCGITMPVLKEVVGRIEDVVTGPDGRQMVRFHGIFVNQPHVQEGQIIQISLDQIIAKVVPTEQFGREDELDIQNRIQQRLGRDVRVVVEKVDLIPRTSSGKFKAVISYLHHGTNR